MSAWARLVSWDGSDEFLELCSAALVEVKTEHARRLAKQIRSAVPPGITTGSPYTSGQMFAADLIDPEVSA
jgi:hypothetical protein